MNMPSDRTTSEEQKWKSFVQGHCDSLFQTALLLSADTTLAAAALADSIGDLDFSNPPEKPASQFGSGR